MTRVRAVSRWSSPLGRFLGLPALRRFLLPCRLLLGVAVPGPAPRREAVHSFLHAHALSSAAPAPAAPAEALATPWFWFCAPGSGCLVCFGSCAGRARHVARLWARLAFSASCSRCACSAAGLSARQQQRSLRRRKVDYRVHPENAALGDEDDDDYEDEERDEGWWRTCLEGRQRLLREGGPIQHCLLSWKHMHQKNVFFTLVF
jgi:hypothetical protein